MSMIAKLSVRAARDFGSGVLVELGCVCENDLMAAYAPSDEDKLFTRYSPWGEARINLKQGAPVPMEGDTYYAILLRPDEVVPGRINHPEATMLVDVSIAGITDRGEGVAKNVDFISMPVQDAGDDDVSKRVASAFSWRMSIDNPGATDQLKAGEKGYLLGFYPVSKFTAQSALASVFSVTLEDEEPVVVQGQ